MNGYLKGEMIQLIFSRKGRVYLVSGTPTKLLIEFLCELRESGESMQFLKVIEHANARLTIN
jgi:hypothetical protein